jgi:hypothetical protein
MELTNMAEVLAKSKKGEPKKDLHVSIPQNVYEFAKGKGWNFSKILSNALQEEIEIYTLAEKLKRQKASVF